MNEARPLLIVTLPSRTLAEAHAEIKLARDAGADLAELRFDRWTAEERSRAAELFPSELPLLATLRSRGEGGEGPDAPDERRAVLEQLSALPFRWIDLEVARDAADIGGAATGRFLSTHLPDDAPTGDLRRALATVAPPGAIVKVVLPATVERLLTEVLPLVNDARARERIVLTTGASGPLLRAWSRRLDYPMVFASLPPEGRVAGAEAVEPSQVPVDRLRHFFSGEPSAPLFAVVGHPVAHSRSPSLHTEWMRAHRHHSLYVALDILTESELVGALDPLAAEGFLGLNVTHPWKAAAVEAATRVNPGAETCGAASCLTFRDGEVEAENTDLAAVLRRLDELRSEEVWDGSELAVIGTGGTAAATLAAARELGAAAYVFARDARSAKSVAERFEARVGLRPEARPFSLVVNATDVGRAGAGPLEVPIEELVNDRTRVLDWVYAADEPTIRTHCDRSKGTYEDGWRLLVYQAAATFGIWWGAEPTADEVETAVREGP